MAKNPHFHANTYKGSRIIWETDPKRIPNDPGFKDILAAHAPKSFEQALQEELVIGRPLFDFLSAEANKKRDPKLPPVDTAYLYAVNARFTRVIISHRTFVMPRAVAEHPALGKEIQVAAPFGSVSFGKYERHFSFLIKHITDPADSQSYALITNYLSLPNDIFRRAARYGNKNLLESYTGLFIPSEHDHIHGITASAVLQSLPNMWVLESDYCKQNLDTSNPKRSNTLISWTWKFQQQESSLRTYEYWVNRLLRKASDNTHSPAKVDTLIKDAKSFLQQVKSLKSKVAEQEGSKAAEQTAMFLACNYLTALQFYLPPGHEAFKRLEPAIATLNLPPVKANMADIAPKLSEITLDIPEHISLPLLAEIVKKENFTIQTHGIRIILDQLEDKGAIKSPADMNSAEISRALKQLKPSEANNYLSFIGKQLASMLVLKYCYTHTEAAAHIWEKILPGLKHNPEAHSSTITAMQQLFDLVGIRHGKLMPELTGMNAIYYRSFVELGGFMNALHQNKGMRFKSEPQGIMERLTDGELMAQYFNDILQDEKMKNISPAIAAAAKKDVQVARLLTSPHKKTAFHYAIDKGVPKQSR